ncbi:MAG: hypothetical protein IJX99_00810 [Clostridia bacterium]|nr:hypothetical protein [Clostridia bacterium]
MEEYDVDVERTYFGLLESIGESKGKYVSIYGRNVTKVSMREQIPIMMLNVLAEDICKKICEKYGFK